MIQFSKYIVVSDVKGYFERMIVFPQEIVHKKMAEAMSKLDFPVVVSAGMIDEFMKCHGESTTLGVNSRKQDTEMLHKMMGIDDKKLEFID